MRLSKLARVIQRALAILRRPGTLVAVPLLIVGVAVHLSDGGGVGVAIVAVGGIGAMVLHQDQLVRLSGRAEASAQAEQQRVQMKLDHLIEAQLSLESAVRVVGASAREISERQSEAAGERAGLAEELRSLDARSSERAGELYRRLDSAHWHRERLHQLGRDTAALRDVLAQRSEVPDLRNWALSPDVALFVAREIRDGGVRQLLELGSGASTEIMARMLQAVGSGFVVAIDHDQAYAERTIARLEHRGVADRAKVLWRPLGPVEWQGRSVEWYEIGDSDLVEEFDLLLVDGPPTTDGSLSRLPAESLFDKVRSGGIILLDDADRADEREVAARWEQRSDLVRVETPGFEKGLAVFRKT